MSWGETLYLKKIIEGQRTLAASDSVMSVLLEGSMNIGSNYTAIPTKFVPKVSGNVRLKWIYEYHLSSGEISALTIQIYEDETQKLSQGYKFSENNNNDVFIDFNVKKGSQYEIRFSSSHNNDQVRAVNVCANIVDTNLIELR